MPTSTSTSIDTMSIVRSMAEGMTALAVISAMAASMSTLVTGTSYVAATGVRAAGVGGIGGIGGVSGAGSGGREQSEREPKTTVRGQYTKRYKGEQKERMRGRVGGPEMLEKLEKLKKGIWYLSNRVIPGIKETLEGLYKHRKKLQLEYKIYLMLPEVELKRKYPQLFFTLRHIRLNENELSKSEFTLFMKKKEHKELERSLGLAPTDPELPLHFIAEKKFKPRVDMEGFKKEKYREE